MYFVTRDFLEALRSESPYGANDQGACSLITDLQTDERAPAFEIEIISDLTVDAPVGEGFTLDQSQEIATVLVDRARRLRQAFKPLRAADLLVCCGDLVAGRKDTSLSELKRVESTYSDICLPAFRQLQDTDRALHRSSDPEERFPKLLTIPGNEDAYRGGRPGHSPWKSAQTPGSDEPGIPSYYSVVAGELAANELPEKPEAHPVAAVFRISTEKATNTVGGPGRVPWACVAVIGFDSNAVQYEHPLASNYGQINNEQLQWSRELVDILRNGVARSVPLYVIALTHHNLLPVEDRVVSPSRGEDDERWVKFRDLTPDGMNPCQPLLCVTNQFLAENSLSTTANASGFLDHCQEIRTSLVMHGNAQQRAATSLVNMPFIAGQRPAEITVLAAPTFAPDHPASGMARVRLDLWKGQAEIALNYETAPDGEPGTGPVQIIRPLVSASRVGAPERRLYARVDELICAALAREDTEHRDEIIAFARHVTEVWGADGYAAVSFRDGSLPHLGPATRYNRYYLLLLLRETEGRNYEMLLSRHSPLRPSEIAEWDTLLMPAFSSVRNLMERLRIDIVRQVVTQAEDLERARSAKTFDNAVSTIQTAGSGVQEDIWLDKIRELGSTHLEKISPTTGEITDYEYRLVVLSPFVRDRRSVIITPETTEEQKKQLRAEFDVVDWLSELPSMQTPGTPLAGRQTLPMEAIMGGGAGLRWEPSIDDEGAVGGTDELLRQTVLPPGSVWFPLPETDDTGTLWQLCPSIAARNGDVMRWVDMQLKSRRSAAGTFPSHIVFGKMQEASGYRLVEGPFPFAAAPNGTPAPGSTMSTVEAMHRVEYTKDYDLAGQHPYRDADIRRVVLARRTIEVRGGRHREVILVFDAADRLKVGDLDLSYFKTCPIDWGGEALGLLRPAQRYVLRAGLDRAEWVMDFMAEESRDDPWGFLRVTYGGAGEPVALTPPIVERVQWDDCDSDDEDKIEFVVCDGNHRTVHKVWNNGQPTAAIGVVSEPTEPYYARPFSPYEWDITAGNVLTISPDSRFRYAPQPVDLSMISEGSRESLTRLQKATLFRRYYRDLNYGFGYVGGQGGNYT